MNNILAITQKELRSYFVSPIAYVVVGFFALLYGYFFVANLSVFLRFSMQTGMFGGGPQAMNINEFMVRPLLGNAGLILVFRPPNDHDAELRGGETVRDDRVTAILPPHRSPGHLGEVSRYDGAVHADARRHLAPHGHALHLWRARTAAYPGVAI